MRVPKVKSPATLLVALFLSLAAHAQIKPLSEVSVSKCWQYATGDDAGIRLASDRVSIFVGYAGGRIEALTRDGKKMWSTDLGGDISSNVLASESGIWVTTTRTADSAGTLRHISGATGLPAWSVALPAAQSHFLAMLGDSLVVVSMNGVIQSMDAGSGTPRWKREIAAGFVSEPGILDNKLVIASTGNQIFVLSMANGEIEAMHKSQFPVSAIGLGTASDLFIGDERGTVTALTLASGKVNWRFKTGGRVSFIDGSADRLLVTSNDNFAYFLVAKNGGLAWKRRLSGRARATAVSDQFVFTASIDEHGASVADLANGKVIGQIALDNEEERFVSEPVISEGSIYALTDRSVYRFGVNGCKRRDAATTAKR